MNKLIILILLGVLTSTAFAQRATIIRVSDIKTNKPIDYASITTLQKSYLTNDFGEAFISNLSKYDTIYISCIGYISQKIPVITLNEVIQIKLSQKSIDLNEVKVFAFTDTKLAELMLEAFKNTQKKVNSFSGEIKTYSIKQHTEPVEYIEGFYNVTCKGNMIDNITLKTGNVLFPKEDLENNFLSVGTTKLIKMTNPYSQSSIYFEFPYKLSTSKILNTYTLKQLNQFNEQLQIEYISKNSKSTGTVIIDLHKKEIIEFRNNWIFTTNYPLVSINYNAKITDTLTVSSTIKFNKNFSYQRVSSNFTYNNKHISTTSILTFIDSTLFSTPFNYQIFNNDYSDILSIPRMDNKATNTLFEMNSKSNMQRLFANAIDENLLVDKNNVSPEFILELTGLSFYDESWNLNWSKLPAAKTEQQLNTQISTFIYADIIPIRDSFILIVEPVFDYFNSTYNYDRNESNAIFISNFMYLTKIEADKLKSILLNELQQGIISNSRFLELCKLHEKNLKKQLFKYKLETNGGNNITAMEKWNTYIIQELKY